MQRTVSLLILSDHYDILKRPPQQVCQSFDFCTATESSALSLNTTCKLYAVPNFIDIGTRAGLRSELMKVAGQRSSPSVLGPDDSDEGLDSASGEDDLSGVIGSSMFNSASAHNKLGGSTSSSGSGSGGTLCMSWTRLDSGGNYEEFIKADKLTLSSTSISGSERALKAIMSASGGAKEKIQKALDDAKKSAQNERLVWSERLQKAEMQRIDEIGFYKAQVENVQKDLEDSGKREMTLKVGARFEETHSKRFEGESKATVLEAKKKGAAEMHDKTVIQQEHTRKSKKASEEATEKKSQSEAKLKDATDDAATHTKERIKKNIEIRKMMGQMRQLLKQDQGRALESKNKARNATEHTKQHNLLRQKAQLKEAIYKTIEKKEIIEEKKRKVHDEKKLKAAAMKKKTLEAENKNKAHDESVEKRVRSQEKKKKERTDAEHKEVVEKLKSKLKEAVEKHKEVRKKYPQPNATIPTPVPHWKKYPQPNATIPRTPVPHWKKYPQPNATTPVPHWKKYPQPNVTTPIGKMKKKPNATKAPVRPKNATTASPNGTEAPSNGTKAPSNGTKAPSNGTEAPANGTEAPSNGTEAPSNGTEAPSNGTEAPANGTEAPSNGTGAPSNGTEAAPNGTKAAPNGTEAPTTLANGTVVNATSGPTTTTSTTTTTTFTWCK